MTSRFLSPAVFSRETDLSFLPQGIGAIGAAFIGPFQKGPAFLPVIVNNNEEFINQFGDTTPEFYTPYAVKNYLREASSATIVRVLGLDGYDHTVAKGFVLNISGSGGVYPLAYIHPSRLGVTIETASIGPAATGSAQFTLIVSGANGTATFNSMSVDPDSPHYFAKVLGTDATSKYDAFAYADFPKAISFISGAAAGSGSISITLSSGQLMLSGSTYGTYRPARTPVIRSQLIGGNRQELFTFFTRGDGGAANTEVKVSIASIRPSPTGTGRGTFSVLVRAFDDTDGSPNILEQFDNLNLDVDDANYIGKRIGTSRHIIDANGDAYLEGDFPNKSRYIYVSMATGIESVPEEALPYGFAPLATPINLTPDMNVPAPGYVTSRYYTPAGASTAVADNKLFYGFDFEDATGLSYLKATPSGSVNSSLTTLKVGYFPSGSDEVPLGGADPGFDLLTMLQAQDITDITPNNAGAYRKFTVPFQGGFDGQNPAVVRFTGASITSTNTMGYDLSDSGKAGARAYAQAIEALSNPDAWDINMLMLPGVIYSQHPYVVQLGIDMCEERGDAFFIMDSDTLGGTVDAAITSVEDLDSNYTATYYPWVKVRDEGSSKNIWVPPSIVMAEVFAFNDKVGAEWSVPAGLNRGGIGSALAVRTRVDKDNRDDLYEGRVNPIANFPAQGIVAWGQKTLQQRASALDRINVRRLLIALKKFIASTGRYILFEPNVQATRQRFLSVINPYLESVQARNGLTGFRVIIDETNNTPDTIDRNILVGKIMLIPARSIEFIDLEFSILPSGANFND